MAFGLFSNRRFSDRAKLAGLDSGDIYERDVRASALKILEHLNSGAPGGLGDVDVFLGKRKSDDTEEILMETSLSDDAKRKLLTVIREGLEKIDTIRMLLDDNFRDNTEIIRFTLMSDLQEYPGNIKNELIPKLRGACCNDFSKVVTFVREKLKFEVKQMEFSF